MKRPAALRSRDGCAEGLPARSMPVLGRRAARPGRAEVERLVLERLCRPTSIGWRAELSSVDAAESFGVSVGQAQHVLRELEKLGMLDSELRPAPRTGLGRRYYWLLPAARTP
jgi:hypothetical protein